MTPTDRLIEIVGIMLQRDLTLTEARELRESYEWIINHERKISGVIAQVKLAISTRDWDWLMELRNEYKRLTR